MSSAPSDAEVDSSESPVDIAITALVVHRRFEEVAGVAVSTEAGIDGVDDKWPSVIVDVK